METKLTPHRKTVLEILQASHDHPTAREVFDRASSRTPRLSFATIYNALKYLTEEGYVRQIRFGEEAVRYDPMLERHDHLICRQCGKIGDLTGMRAPELPKGKAEAAGFLLESVNVQFLGLCKACRASQKKA
jgi:Fur family peroxide stress response transcriptional regulator